MIIGKKIRKIWKSLKREKIWRWDDEDEKEWKKYKWRFKEWKIENGMKVSLRLDEELKELKKRENIKDIWKKKRFWESDE